MRLPRSVTDTPTGMPFLNLKVAMDFLARLIIGFWPAICDHIFDAIFDKFGVAGCFTETHIDYNFDDAGVLASGFCSQIAWSEKGQLPWHSVL